MARSVQTLFFSTAPSLLFRQGAQLGVKLHCSPSNPSPWVPVSTLSIFLKKPPGSTWTAREWRRFRKQDVPLHSGCPLTYRQRPPPSGSERLSGITAKIESDGMLWPHGMPGGRWKTETCSASTDSCACPWFPGVLGLRLWVYRALPSTPCLRPHALAIRGQSNEWKATTLFLVCSFIKFILIPTPRWI